MWTRNGSAHLILLPSRLPFELPHHEKKLKNNDFRKTWVQPAPTIGDNWLRVVVEDYHSKGVKSNYECR